MITFLIKSTICLSVLLAIYHLLLEKEKMHTFNRFYLLFALVFSFILPFITIEIVKELPQALPKIETEPPVQIGIHPDEQFNYLNLLSISYAVITLFLSVRFIANILKINNRVKNNPTIKHKKARLVIVKENILPHTFLNTIFISENEYNNSGIERELYEHELTHVTQKHTLDVLFIEVIKTIFWFNPVFLFYKKAIQLNHEFLADEKVVKSYDNIPFYQQLLLSKANGGQTVYLASNLNYLITKKRLIMMTKTTSASVMLLKKLALLPLFTGLLLFLCTETVAQSNPKPTKEKTTVTQKDQVKFPLPKNAVTKKTSDPNQIYDQVTESPEFPGGMKEFYSFIGKNFKTPAAAKTNARVIVEFVVEKDGNLGNFNILRDPVPGAGAEAIRVLKASPKWTPGKLDGETVRVKYALPISITAKS